MKRGLGSHLSYTELIWLEYEQLMELSAIDYISSKDGFEIFYEMLSLTKRKRLRVKTFIKEKEAIAKHKKANGVTVISDRFFRKGVTLFKYHSVSPLSYLNEI